VLDDNILGRFEMRDKCIHFVNVEAAISKVQWLPKVTVDSQ